MPDEITGDVAGRRLLQRQLVALRHEKELALARVRALELKEEHLAVVYERAFPGETFRPPAVPWAELTYRERMTVHFLSHRGGARKLSAVVDEYGEFSGEIITRAAWAVRLSRLLSKGAVSRNFFGWFVSDELAEVAQYRPDHRSERSEIGAEGLLNAARAIERTKKTPGTRMGAPLGPRRMSWKALAQLVPSNADHGG
ncbi:MAG: hypothetical protein Q8P18_22615 [Pseudomonadota bacterium]|nr:hypothetical protein [Pseudomonadota bacterium]